ncbi:MAG: cytochrome c-type biogenesis protein CcmH [Myxococcota bacterium]|nr:cytochrome c-type biogenesis protein CcmH [Myxococcota bacterium]
MIWLLASLSLAQSPQAAFPITAPPMCDAVPPELLDKETDDLGRELACPICSGQSVSGSQTPVALGMKEIIHTGLAQGYCPEQITEYFISVYGDDVVLDPSKQAGNAALIWMPLLGVFAGFGLAAFWWVRQPKVPLEKAEPAPVTSPADESAEDPYAAQVLRELDE